jgi:hypothetical protein
MMATLEWLAARKGSCALNFVSSLPRRVWCGLNPFSGVTVNILSAAHHLAWTQYPATWICESCAILWLVLRAMRSSLVRVGVLLMLSGLVMNAVVTEANAGVMPVVGMPSTLRPSGPMWGAATPKTRLSFLADQARLGLFSVGDLLMLFGGIVIVGVGLRRTSKNGRSLS